ncbi:polysaccharide deacetylase family protein [Chitinophaga caseinilytica]|uniref:polysaccharide deacetylase family protein n=1 Tax=Chitinophaga caseinilytica TaxID=2267521 RepID=UPI003C2F406C
MLRAFVIAAAAAAAGVIILLHGGWAATPAWKLLIPLLVASGFAAWGAINVRSNYFVRTHSKGKRSDKSVALSFDDGPLTEFTPQILDILAQFNVRAAFFCIGHRVEQEPALMKRIVGEGHLVGNHSFSHSPTFDLQTTAAMKTDLARANEVIKSATGLQPRLFRPPYGVTNPMLARAIRKGKFIAVGWSVRSFDTVIKDEDKLFERVTKKIEAGDIFLFHDTAAATVRILPALIKQLKRDGFAIKRLDELLNIPAYA